MDENRLYIAAQWQREGLKVRPISIKHVPLQQDVLCTHTLTIDPTRLPIDISLTEHFEAWVYVHRTRYTPIDRSAPLLLAAKLQDFLYATVLELVVQLYQLSPKHRAGLSAIWGETLIFDVFLFDAHRYFRDCPARQVFNALHMIGLEYRNEAWLPIMPPSPTA